MSQAEQRITSLAALGEHRGEIDVIQTHKPRQRIEDQPAAGYSDNRFDNRFVQTKRPPRQSAVHDQQRGEQRQQPIQEQPPVAAARPGPQNANMKRFPGSRRTSVEELMRHIYSHTGRDQLPSLEEYIMALQEHTFSFVYHNPNQLHKFIAAQELEHELNAIAYRGGEEYMMALMIHMNYAVAALIQHRTRPRPAPEHHKARPAVAPASVSETPTPDPVVVAQVEQTQENGTGDTKPVTE